MTIASENQMIIWVLSSLLTNGGGLSKFKGFQFSRLLLREDREFSGAVGRKNVAGMQCISGTFLFATSFQLGEFLDNIL